MRRRDRWIDANRALHAHALAAGIAHDYDEAPAGHEWSYWQEIVPEHVEWHARVGFDPRRSRETLPP